MTNIKNNSIPCKVCKSRTLPPFLDLGSHPVCNRYSAMPDQAQERFPLSLCQCGCCGLIQSRTPVPVDKIRPPFSWINYREPEGHLDRIAEMILDLPGMAPDKPVAGISEYDRPLLDRLRQKGHRNVILPVRDKNDPEGSDMAWLQDRISSDHSFGKALFPGPTPFVLAAGFILEHAYDPLLFLKSLGEIIPSSGYLAVQVPDFGWSMEKQDFCSIWEEHILYFTGRSFDRCPVETGYEPVKTQIFSHDDGRVLFGVWRKTNDDMKPDRPKKDIRREINRAESFGQAFGETGNRIRARLEEMSGHFGPAALFGAGHQACQFINLFGLSDLLAFVIDDDKNKLGLFMPGSLLKIRSSEELKKGRIKACLLGMSPGLHGAIKKKFCEFTHDGGIFESIYEL